MRVAFAALCVLAATVQATDLGVNLLENPDAETGDMSGWTPIDKVEIHDARLVGDNGLPKDHSLGTWVFSGGTGDLVEHCSQAFDVSDLSKEIDAGVLRCILRGVLQSRKFGESLDTVTIIVTFNDANGEQVGLTAIKDPSIEPEVADWNEFVVMPTIPEGTREIEYTIQMERANGSSTDAYADNLSLVIGCPADCDLSGTLNILDFVCFQSLFQSGDMGADVNQDGALSILDFVVFQQLFTAGCG
jgi:hypothetical protein